jgi:hypothetical protein
LTYFGCAQWRFSFFVLDFGVSFLAMSAFSPDL